MSSNNPGRLLLKTANANKRNNQQQETTAHSQQQMNAWMNVETLNNGNGLLLSPPHNNSCQQQQQQQRFSGASGTNSNTISISGAGTASSSNNNSNNSNGGSSSKNLTATGGSGSGVGGSGSGSSGSTSTTEHNLQITQPISAPSSPLASPGAISTSTSFCLPTSSTFGALVAAAAAAAASGNSGNSVAANTSIGNSGSYVMSAGVSSTNYEDALQVDTADPNWQSTKATVLERNAAMFNNDLMSDVTFIVGGDFDTVQTIPAHKYILATGSSVFYAMFYGGLAEHKQEIKVPDVEPSAFLTLLRYLYCDEIQLEPDNILATLYAAKKYIVPHLARACVNYLEVKLTAKNACLLLSQSRLFEEPELMQRCWEVIDAQAEMAIKSEDFVDIDLKTFESILSRETLNCKEIHLFEAALNWALNACQKINIEFTPQNKRNVLGQALHLIRIPTMSLEEFANGVAQTGILTSQETIDTFLHFTANIKPALNFPTRPRAGLKTQVCHRFQSCAYRSNQWRYRGRCDSIQFSVDRRIFIIGFGLYGSSTGAANYNVKIELRRLGRTLAANETKFFSDGSSNTFHVFFENPIQIEPECYYTASVVVDGNELSFFGQEGMSEVCMGNVTFQFQCSSESTNGTGVQGGQIPELIFYGPTITAVNSTNSLCGTPIIGLGGSGSGSGGSSSGSGSGSGYNGNTTTTGHGRGTASGSGDGAGAGAGNVGSGASIFANCDDMFFASGTSGGSAGSDVSVGAAATKA